MDALPEPVQLACASFLHAVNTTAEGLVDALWLRGSVARGDFGPSSDIDFTAVLSRRPGQHDLVALEAAHTQLWFEQPEHDFDGHHLLLDDLRRPAADCPPVPCSHQGRFLPQADLDVNPVSWAELAQRGVRVAGRDPGVMGIHVDPDALRDFARADLAEQWARTARDLKVGWLVAGRRDDTVAWATLGAARAHRLLTTGEPSSRGEAGRHVLAHLDPRWHPLAREALRIRERPHERSGYRSHAHRGKDLRDFVTWCVAEGTLPTDRAGSHG